MALAEVRVRSNKQKLAQRLEDHDALGVNEKWPFPSEMDGWVHEHNAIRQDLQNIEAAADTLSKMLRSRRPLRLWQVHNIQKAWRLLAQRIISHHHIEGRILFPWLESRARLPGSFVAAHIDIEAQLQDCSRALEQLHCTANPDYEAQLLEGFQALLSSLKPDLQEAMAREEREGLPLMRKHFSHKELRPVQQRMAAAQSWQQQAAVLHAMDEETRSAFLSQSGVPWLVAKLVVQPKVLQYQRTVAKLLCDIMDDTGRDKKPNLCSK